MGSMAALGALGLAACGGTSTSGGSDFGGSGEAGAVEQVFNFNLGSEPPTANSLQATDLFSYYLIRPTFCGLTRLDEDNNVEPDIAESWDVSDDLLTYTFHLRDAKWSNGDPVTSNDYLFAWSKLLDPEYGAPYSYIFYDIEGAAEYNMGEADVSALGISAPDDKTLEVKLVNPIPYFTFLCTQPMFFPIQQKFFEDCEAQGENTYASDPDKILSNGPFMIDTWEHNSKIVLKKNPNYWDVDNIKLETVNLLEVADNNTNYNMFTAGELDIASLTSGDLEDRAKEAGYDIRHTSTGATYYILLKLDSGPLANANFRKALAYAIDRQSLITNVLRSSSQPALSFTSPDILTSDGQEFHDLVGDCFKDADVEGAKAAMETALKELGLSEPPTLDILIADDDEDRTKAAAFQETWKQTLGVECNISALPRKARLEKMHNGDYQVAFSAWGPDYDDPMTYLEMFMSNSSMNETGYENAEFDELMEDAKTTTDQAKRTDDMVQAEKTLMSDMPIIPLYFAYNDMAVSNKVEGFYSKIFQGENYIHAEKIA